MILFEISTGALLEIDDGQPQTIIGSGYAGNNGGLNNAGATDQHGVGPLPVGYYVIEMPLDKKLTGPFSIPLTPDRGNEMYGRSGFFVHGGLSGEPDTSPLGGPPGPRTASDGCIVTARTIRQEIARHQILQVVL